jgi:glutathione S-transferase
MGAKSGAAAMNHGKNMAAGVRVHLQCRTRFPEPAMDFLPPLVALTICLAIAVYIWTIVSVSRARGKYGIRAPATTGNADFERVFRAQQNTLEHLVMFVPCILLFSRFVSPLWAAGIGLVWVLSRIWYAIGYAAPGGNQRSMGFGISFAATGVLLVGALIGIVVNLSRV